MAQVRRIEDFQRRFEREALRDAAQLPEVDGEELSTSVGEPARSVTSDGSAKCRARLVS
jgi:hypothetical protein